MIDPGFDGKCYLCRFIVVTIVSPFFSFSHRVFRCNCRLSLATAGSLCGDMMAVSSAKQAIVVLAVSDMSAIV